ncbi:hypothetical protein H8356DRAFT_1693599 [Neocallimastix lanati (nom. inval.)]|nr:hypothetical protein H8356DRAFT_1693599 [Neocallimastix sp. JGI-2020a]
MSILCEFVGVNIYFIVLFLFLVIFYIKVICYLKYNQLRFKWNLLYYFLSVILMIINDYPF